jgi:Fe2+ or Zn2+ uptake regulation protein
MVTGRREGTDEVHAKIASLLGAHQQRYTTQRRSIVEALVALERPATIGELVEASPRLPLSTAYRNLTVLSEAKVVRRVSGADEFGRFELSEELSGHHHHVVCESCGLVMDAAASPRLEAALTETARAIAEANGFDVTDHRLELVGRCTSCRSAAAS